MPWTRIEVEATEFNEAHQTFREAGFGSFGYLPEAIRFRLLDTKFVDAEWRVVDGNIEMHVFHHGRPTDLLWNHRPYAEALFMALITTFSMDTFPDRLRVEFVPEVNAWYVLIKGVAQISEPDPSRLVSALDMVRP